MKQIKFFALICVFITAAMFSGCSKNKSKPLFTDIILPEQNIAEDVTATAEFPEYDGDVEEIKIFVANNGERNFGTGEMFRMQKMENGEWRDLAVRGTFKAIAQIFEPGINSTYTAKLKDHVKLPLPSGEYRIGVGFEIYPTEDDLIAFAEFTIK